MRKNLFGAFFPKGNACCSGNNRRFFFRFGVRKGSANRQNCELAQGNNQTTEKECECLKKKPDQSADDNIQALYSAAWPSGQGVCLQIQRSSVAVQDSFWQLAEVVPDSPSGNFSAALENRVCLQPVGILKSCYVLGNYCSCLATTEKSECLELWFFSCHFSFRHPSHGRITL